MKAKKLARRAARTTALFGALLCLCAGYESTLLAAPVDSVSSLGIAGSDEFKGLVASDLMLLGPVEAIDYRAATVQVLGQTVRLSSSARRVLRRLAVGNVVVVHGRILGVGEIEANALSIASRQYVAGAQTLFLRGLVSTLHSDVGALGVGNLRVDYTGALHSLDASSLNVGVEFVISGIQAAPNGSVLALDAAVRPSGITGSDVQAKGITGSDVQAKGITGSDVQAKGITGSDVQAKGITGSDVQAKGITGSDVQAIGITGSDVQAKGITGSDVQAIGITGSDVQAKGITGSDVQAKGITGSDVQAKGITGSDVQAIGITGSDVQAKGITGSDVQAIGITGSDVQAKGITGSDVQAIGITGSDVQAKGITGSDVQAKGITGSDVAGIAGSDF